MPDPFDAFDTDERPRSAYMSRKDWKIALVALAVMIAVLFPIYRSMLAASQNHLCVQNFQQISNAIGVYMASNNDRYPPAFVEVSPGEPMLFDAGDQKAPYSWMTLVRSAMEERSNFLCPTASSDEIAQNIHPDKIRTSFGSSYGLYVPRSGWPQSMIQNPDQAVVIAETSNRGSAGSYDPVPFESPYDGIAIGWNDGNLRMSKASQFVTRLAFRETSNASFRATGPSRHEKGINVLFASGRKGVIGPSDARIQRLGESATGYWADR